MSRLFIACSGFKDVLSPRDLCETLKNAFLSLDPSLLIDSLPLSDGGEGFLQSLSTAFSSENYKICSTPLIGPLGTEHFGQYGILYKDEEKIGIVELAKASGIEHVPETFRNCYNTTSHGTGQVIQSLYEQGCRKMYIGLGGSATTDGGLSVLYPLEGFKFDFQGERPLFITGKDLRRIVSVTRNEQSTMNDDLEITIACDVNNPMLGFNGSTYIFGPQKGIKQNMLEEYEGLMNYVASLLGKLAGEDVASKPHSGAAGGVAGGLMAGFPKARVLKGIEFIGQAVGLAERARDADIVITGEGCFDLQTKGGKVVSKIQELRPDCYIVCGLNKSGHNNRVFDLTSRFGPRSLTHAKECLNILAQEMLENFNKLNK